MRENIYLVSQDLWMLFAKWAVSFGFIIPDKDYFAKLSLGIVCDLQLIFSKGYQNVRVQLISFDQVCLGLKERLSLGTKNLVISLDKVYYPGDFQLEINRVVYRKDGEWKDLGECSRPGFESIDQQLDRIESGVNGNIITLVDDGCWSGDSVSRVVRELLKRNINIDKVLVGVYIRPVPK